MSESNFRKLFKEYTNEEIINIVTDNSMYDDVKSLFVHGDGIDFSKPSSITNGYGVYIMGDTKNDTNPIYYYRGAVENNKVKLEYGEPNLFQIRQNIPFLQDRIQEILCASRVHWRILSRSHRQPVQGRDRSCVCLWQVNVSVRYVCRQ